MRDDRFTLELLGAQRADVYLSGADQSARAWRLVRALDEESVRAVAARSDIHTDGRQLCGVMGRCSGMAAAMPAREAEPSSTDPGVVRDLRQAVELQLPLALVAETGVRVGVEQGVLRVGAADPIPLADSAIVHFEEDADAAVAWLLARGQARGEPTPPYAYLIGRLERDFAHARDAIRAAVESEAGIPCLWSDDGAHRTDVESVRERTRLLIRDACFVIADLTLGPENPEHENPSRAHEIGMAIGYDREIMLCSQEPRRYPYFSIGDMQMTFWTDEAELERSVANWIRATPGLFRRRVLNHELPQRDPEYEPRIPKPAFRFDRRQRFVGPNVSRPSRVRAAARGLGLGVVLIAVAAVLVVLK